MGFRAIPGMAGKAVLGIFAVELLHVVVPGDFGKDAGGGYAQTARIPFDEVEGWQGESWDS